MTIDTRKLLKAGGIAILAASISGCMSSGGGGGGGSQSAARGIEGDWDSGDGIAVSSFAGGIFTTKAKDTGNKLADGSYRINGDLIEITVISLIRNTTSSVNCKQVDQNQLNCTSSTGSTFVLRRRVAA
ncbi:MAG: hypothetical protein ABWZ57_13445 [Mesorhizobium sp.]|jgi:hypothetical protein